MTATPSPAVEYAECEVGVLETEDGQLLVGLIVEGQTTREFIPTPLCSN